MPNPLYMIQTNGQLDPHLSQEWLVTNGLGGYASSTVVGCDTRRYHGLLCAAITPPVGRMMTLNRIGEILVVDGNTDRLLEFSINQFGGGNFHPRGDRYLRRFEMDETTVRWEYDVDGIGVTKELQMSWMRNVTLVRYTVDPRETGKKVELWLLPFVSMRDFHQCRRGANADFKVYTAERRVVVGEGDVQLTVEGDVGKFVSQPDWWYGHKYQVEAERGLDDTEDLFTPGKFTLEVSGKTQITLYAATEPMEAVDWEGESERRRQAVMAAGTDPENLSADAKQPKAPIDYAMASPVLRRLAHAANDFIVYRKAPDGSDGTSVIAGYPWFADWGRDTFISLPGLLLTTGRYHQARQVLSVFAQYVSEGMIPNRFDDYSNEPHYNTVDASLWFIHAAFEYLRLSGDSHTFETRLLPACRAIVEGYKQGTRFHIKMDPADGLISQGDAQTQLTWMDAKCGDVAFTPRQGKAVEINALWYHALKLLGQNDLAAQVAESFKKAFWISPFRGLADVVNSDASAKSTNGYRRDVQVRPNQIFAVSLPNSPLTPEQQSAVVELVRRELLTPMGLRTLAKGEPNYRGWYHGVQFERDKSYHNGTVWAWPLGAFLEAYLKVNGRSNQALAQGRLWLAPLIDHMSDSGCIGQISEIFEGDPPHRPVGCFAQAWSVAEVLRLAVDMSVKSDAT